MCPPAAGQTQDRERPQQQVHLEAMEESLSARLSFQKSPRFDIRQNEKTKSAEAFRVDTSWLEVSSPAARPDYSIDSLDSSPMDQ